MNLRIEPAKITYHGLHPQGGWKFKRHELEPFFMEANWIEDIDPVVRRKHPSATWFSATEIRCDGSEHWLCSGTI